MVDVEVTFEYAAEQEDELNIKVGDIIKNVTMSEGGWWEGELNGKVGMFPDNFVKVIEKPKPTKVKEDPPPAVRKDKQRGASVRELASKIKDDVHVGIGAPKKKEAQPNAKRKRAKVVFSYEPENEDELKLEVGDIVDVLKQEEEGWWEGSLNGKVGMFPSNFAEEIEETDPERTPEEKPNEAPVEGKKKLIGGIGLGNIFEGGPIKLKSTSVKNTDKVTHSPPDPVVRRKEEESKPNTVTKREKHVERALVRYSYTADNDDELTLQEGEIITILDKELEDAGWWKGEVNGRVGVFPDNFVEDLPMEESDSISKPSSVHHNKMPPQPRPKKPPPPGSAKQAPKLPEKAPVSDVVKHEKHEKHDKPLPPEPTSSDKAKKKDETDKHHPPAISSKKPSVPPPVGRKPMQSKPAEPKPPVSVQRDEPKVMHIKEEKKDHPADSFDNMQTSDRLTHLTASRAKGPSKRPPSQKHKNNMRVFQEDTKINGDIPSVKEVKEPPKRPPLTREMKEESPPAKPAHAPARPPDPNPGNAVLLSAIEELKKEMRELRATCVSKSAMEDLRSENEKLRMEVEQIRSKQSRQIKDLMAEVDEEKKIRLNTQVEIERIRKLLTESHV
ncbi:SH3 domain-containing kinase-binding protein 1-like isoform X3 [Pecten maximus]|uniref:SH3 domain-containing kinase-binding protein 1-like isoform X3 n=1 Tax=Pecten maximus TaxID=6579 RepID=UPI0014591103|nr:SH3 domain-containing kinase-binding protein 1-like isoform X3 [Pecten maximus]